MKQLFLFLAALCCAATIHAADDVVPGKFTINADGDQVQFARGNLQAIGTGNPSSWTWRIAENQWDYAGKENNRNNILLKPNSAGFPGAVYDLFGWSTDQTYYGLNLSTSNSDYSGEFVDWGNLMGEGWRTLTYDEWEYIWNRRENARALRGIATFSDGLSNYTNGYIFLPDDADYKELGFNPGTKDWDDNRLHFDSKVLQAGAVFLPAAGESGVIMVNDVPVGRDVYLIPSTCHYWASTPYGEEYASALYITKEHGQVDKINDRWCGYSVRLVRDVADTEDIDDVRRNDVQCTKVVRDGQILILRGDKTYTLQGQEVK